MNKLLREPLLHFILIGLGLFLLYGWVSDESKSQDTIYFDDYDMNNIIASWEMQWKRLPTDEELKSLVEQNIRQEIFYQEALKMNLDHNDEIIKRRLAQKMNFLSNDLATLKEPSEEELKEYYAENKEAYLLPPVYSFYQISFRSDGRTNPRDDAEQLLKRIGERAPGSLKEEGDALPFPYFFEMTDGDELGRQLGMKFSKSIETLEISKWAGPIRSGFGWHLVYVSTKTPARAPRFESIRKELKRDLEYEKQRKVNDQVYRELKNKYEIEFDLDPEKFDASFVDYLQARDDSQQ
jgi:hypothetical protein